ncbi:MAG TPA: TIGR04086 family membrane protein [Candidatus Merdenecus merdavium]|nr:TIGR04086 family membrane protein [Candidatus Merdenecus merdavium]
MDKVIKKKSLAMVVLKSLLVSYIITGVSLLLLALLLFKFDLDRGKIAVGIILIYIISSFLGGFIIGKSMKSRKFIWGMAIGCSYFIVLMIVSFMVNKTIQSDWMNIATTFIMCIGGGMLGGMLS